MAERDPEIEFIIREPGMSARLLAEHADDGSGRCMVCTTGAQRVRLTFPCTIHSYAAAADEVERQAGTPHCSRTGWVQPT